MSDYTDMPPPRRLRERAEVGLRVFARRDALRLEREQLRAELALINAKLDGMAAAVDVLRLMLGQGNEDESVAIETLVEQQREGE